MKLSNDAKMAWDYLEIVSNLSIKNRWVEF
ncbi:hypothetical protein ACVNPZ_16685 [Staphylococcus aureus]